MCGIKHIKQAYFLVILNMPQNFDCGLKIEKIGNIASHYEYQDLELIKRVFDIKGDNNQNFLSHVYNKLALKNY